jgi:hypothetical protein
MAAGVVLVQEGGGLETLVAEVAPEITRSELSINLQVLYGSLVSSYRILYPYICDHIVITNSIKEIISMDRLFCSCVCFDKKLFFRTGRKI